MTNILLAQTAARLPQSSWLDAIGNAWLLLWAGIVVKLISSFVELPLGAAILPAEWLRRRGIAPRRAPRASPLDKPNTVLIFARSSRVRLTHLGVERDGLSCVFLYLDHPQELIQTVANETQRR